ncbi:hypothetical protein [Phytobacter sp. RSE-02]|uniref:hypothetical protein n=1 Tax=Phytobacter sp. RSE-02 TaxID=3229229 RepID=UPI00339D5E5B
MVHEGSLEPCFRFWLRLSALLLIFFHIADYHFAAIVLCAGSKAGNEKHFYAEMISRAEQEYANYLKKPEKEE